MIRRSFIIVGFIWLTGCSLPSTTVDLSTKTDTSVDNFTSAISDLGQELNQRAQLLNLKATLEQDQLADRVYYPVHNYHQRRSLHTFGEYAADQGYHTGDDLDQPANDADLAFFAVATGQLIRKQANGNDGMLILEFTMDEVIYHAMYNHINVDSVTAAIGDTVQAGAQLGTIAQAERTYLHFGMYPYTNTLLFAEYTDQVNDLTAWLDPFHWLLEHS